MCAAGEINTHTLTETFSETLTFTDTFTDTLTFTDTFTLALALAFTLGKELVWFWWWFGEGLVVGWLS